MRLARQKSAVTILWGENCLSEGDWGGGGYEKVVELVAEEVVGMIVRCSMMLENGGDLI